MSAKFRIKVPDASHYARRSSAPAQVKEIFPRYKEQLLKKLDKSIHDAEVRYIEENYASQDNPIERADGTTKIKAFASELWTPIVSKQGNVESVNIEKEEARAGLKIGKKWWKVLEDSNGLECETVRLHGKTQLIPKLQEWKTMVESFEVDNDGGKAFHAIAIEQARPTVDRENYEYDKSSDTYKPKS